MAYGYVPTRVPGAGHPSPNQYGQYTIADDYNTLLIAGDLVALHTDGTLINHTVSLLMIGVFGGVEYVDDSTGEVRFDSVWTASQSIKSGTTAYGYVFDDPDIVLKAQSDQDTTAFALAQVGELADTDAAAGNATIKRSSEAVDSSSAGTGSGGNLKLLGSAQLDRAFTAAGSTMDVFVMPNEHRLKAAIDGI